MKILHNFESKKSKNGLWGAKLQHKVSDILRRGEHFRKFNATTKGMLRICKVAFVNTLCLPLLFENVRTDEQYRRLYVVTLLPINRFWIFWTLNYVEFSRGGARTGQKMKYSLYRYDNLENTH